ncbi:MAG: translation elongation factor Ts [Pseudomonadota bacterium]
MAVTAALVKELRDRTGAGMMECKKALVATGGDIDAAIEHLRKSGQAKADKKSGRTAAEGVVVVKSSSDESIVVEVNSETDFVAKDENFMSFADTVAQRVLEAAPDSVAALNDVEYAGGKSIAEARTELVAKVGENVGVRRFERLPTDGGAIASYVHGSRIAALVAYKGGDADFGRDIAMHVSASAPLCVDEAGVPAEKLDNERRILTEQAQDSGKPDDIIAKMVEGRLRKYLGEITLLGQPFVKDPDLTVGKLAKQKGAEILGFVRYEVGEGIEKKQDNFAEEVMKQIEDAKGKDDATDGAAA